MALDRWTRLQAAPFGTSSSLRNDERGGATGRNLRRRDEDYRRATRLLRRQANNGDERSALNLIALREQAIDRGIDTSGFRRREEYDAAVRGEVDAMEQGALDRERAATANRTLTDEVLADTQAAAPAPAAPATPPPSADSRDTAALDIYEGEITQNDATMQRGLDMASRLGVRSPTSLLRQNNVGLAARKLLDRKLGTARSPGDLSELRDRASRLGIPAADFERRANWWERNRKI